MTTRSDKKSSDPRELRVSVSDIETRASDDGLVTVSGHAAVFDQETEIAWFREVIRPGAFADAIGRDDVVFVINHEGLPLARTGSGTLTLKEDQRGLYMETKLDPEDPDVASILPKMRRGDLTEMSFAFRSGDESWHEFEDDGLLPLREIKKVEKLYDVSIVTNGAYPQTDIALRSFNEFKKEAGSHSARTRKRKMKMDRDIRTRISH